ncbi:Alcohol dehydrogenase [Brevinematales bacterium NS]|nr:iron-containing alcohol dehydrogenase [Brevinematales bacterium]QJR20852.1 Alcohol dehydrogenase [Brevinematales bacterium NS]
MGNWQWYTPPVFSGRGCRFSLLLEYLSSCGKRWALCCGRHFFDTEWAFWRERACATGLEVEAFVVSGGEPTVEVVDTLVTSLKKWQPEGLVAIGGGSVLDTTKAAAAMLVHEGSVQDYLEEVGTKKLVFSPLPWVGVPTTAGTGSEVTKNAVIIVPEKRVKRSLRHENLWAKAVFLDPELTLSAPWEVTVNAAFDAFTHLLEAAVSRKSHLWAFALADVSLPEIVDGLVRVKEDGSDLESRERLLMASTAGGIALANAGLGAVHGFAATLGGMTTIPHGRVCGILLDHVVEVNSQYTDGYERLAFVRSCGGTKGFIRFLSEWKEKMGIEKDFKPFNLRLSAEEIVRLSTSSSMKANPADVPSEVWIKMWERLL